MNKKINSKSLKTLTNWLAEDYSDFRGISERKIISSGEKQALRLFKLASKKVPAYKDFLKRNQIKPDLVKTISDFSKVPSTTKENYITKYSFKSRLWNGSFDGITMISSSSGTTGEPCYWPRSLIHEIEGAYPHELIFKKYFKINNRKTLFINGFALGNWIAGTFTQTIINLMSWKGYPITIMSPGYSLDDVISVLENISTEFEMVIISGHIPFLKEVIELAYQKKITSKIDIRLLGTGQAVTEKWRSYVQSKITFDMSKNSVINLYGSADAALIGWESPITISIRKAIGNDNVAREAVFNSSRMPALFMYDPRLTYLESYKNEIHITKNFGSPLIKYNIHDSGGVIGNNYLKKQISKHVGVKLSNKIDMSDKLPFVYLFGRDKFMVKIYGANIYSEHVDHAFAHESLQKIITGRYISESFYDDENDQRIRYHIEMQAGIDINDDVANMIRDIFISEVSKINSEYGYVLKHVGKKTHPEIKLHRHESEKYFSKEKMKKYG